MHFNGFFTHDLLEDKQKKNITTNVILPLCHRKELAFMLLQVCPEIDHPRCQNLVRASETHLAAPHMPFFVLTTF